MTYLVPTQVGIVQVPVSLHSVPGYLRQRDLKVERYACAHAVLEDESCWTCTIMRAVVIPNAIGYALNDGQYVLWDCVDGDHISGVDVPLPWWECSRWFVYPRKASTRVLTIYVGGGKFDIDAHGHERALGVVDAQYMKEEIIPLLRSFEDNLKHWR